MPETWVTEILQFWFDEIAPEAWFRRDDAFDQRLCERFLDRHEQIAAKSLAQCASDAPTALAAVIALDQFPRNMFRGTPRAFASDTKAREIAEQAIQRGFDGALSKDQRTFLYLPLEHAEDPVAQARSVELIAKLGDAQLTRYAEEHKAIIDRFGRFPHRNAILGRSSTPDEIAFLAEPGNSF